MATVHDMLRRFQALNLNKEAIKVVVDRKEDIVSLNREQLMDDGINKIGLQLSKYKSDAYAKKKNRMNPSPGLGVPDLNYTGAFQESFKIRIMNEKKYEIYATDSKAPKLAKIYGKDIFGLTKASREQMIKEFFRHEFMQNVKQTLKL